MFLKDRPADNAARPYRKCEAGRLMKYRKWARRGYVGKTANIGGRTLQHRSKRQCCTNSDDLRATKFACAAAARNGVVEELSALPGRLPQ